jgi:hypothetical protein
MEQDLGIIIMMKLDLKTIIRDIRNQESDVVKFRKIVFPYLEMYPRCKKKLPALVLEDSKVNLMKRVRNKFQSWTNPYQHDLTLKKEETQVVLKRVYKKEIEGICTQKGKSFKKRLACHSVTPQKKNLLFRHLLRSPSITDKISDSQYLIKH